MACPPARLRRMRITLIHALKHSIVPIEASFAKLWPEARLMNLLDDSLSAVDTDTEERILRGLRSVMKERTTILVSHRVSTVKGADQMMVVKARA